jgi:hypothetical protein
MTLLLLHARTGQRLGEFLGTADMRRHGLDWFSLLRIDRPRDGQCGVADNLALPIIVEEWLQRQPSFRRHSLLLVTLFLVEAHLGRQ